MVFSHTIVMEKLVRELAVPGLTTDITFDFELFYQDVKAEIVKVRKERCGVEEIVQTACLYAAVVFEFLRRGVGG